MSTGRKNEERTHPMSALILHPREMQYKLCGGSQKLSDDLGFLVYKVEDLFIG